MPSAAVREVQPAPAPSEPAANASPAHRIGHARIVYRRFDKPPVSASAPRSPSLTTTIRGPSASNVAAARASTRPSASRLPRGQATRPRGRQVANYRPRLVARPSLKRIFGSSTTVTPAARISAAANTVSRHDASAGVIPDRIRYVSGRGTRVEVAGPDGGGRPASVIEPHPVPLRASRTRPRSAPTRR